jgi:hypothetical protein
VTRVPIVAIAIALACAGMTGFVYLQTRPPQTEAVVQTDRVAQAVATTSAVKSFSFSYSASISAAGHSITMRGNGSYDVEHKLVSMKMNFDGAPAGSPLSQPMEMVVDYSNGFIEYIHAAALDGQLPAGKSWAKIDVGAAAKKLGVDLGQLSQSDSADPSKIFETLRKSGNPVEVGPETVGGVATTHYAARVDVRRLAAAETDSTTRANLLKAISVTGVSSYPVEVWIDEAGYLRRMRTTLAEPIPGMTGMATVAVSEELTDFGAAPAVALPPAATVVDIADLS